MILLAQEAYGFAYSQFARHVFGRTAVRSVAHHQQVSRDLFPHSGQNVYAIQDSFYWTKVRDVNEELFTRGRETPCRGFFGSRFVGFKVYEIVDHADFVAHAENLLGALANEFADAGDAVRLLNREFRDGEIRTVRADQGDVGAVQRGNEGQPTLGREHLLCQQRGNGMRNGVMHVQQVE